jgi:Phasin protein
MAKKEYHAGQTETATPFSLIPSGFITMSKKQIHECVKAHSELVDRLQEANRSWFDHLRSEADLSAEFASKMTAVRSIPDAATVLLEWTNRHMEMAASDAKNVLADTQKFMEMGARLVPGGWLFNGKDGDSSTSTPPAGFPRPLSSS